MEGRERLSWIKSSYTVLTFSFIEMFAKDLVGYIVWVEGTLELQGRCVLCECLRVCVSPAAGGRRGHKGGDAA